MSEPNDPVTVLAAMAAELHELYSAYVEAGFTEWQAFELIKITVAQSWSSS